MPDYPSRLIRERELLDGRKVVIRPIRADDDLLEQDFLRTGVSGESRYMRFHKWVGAPSDKLIHFLTDIDYDRHMAFVCVHGEGDDAEVCGEARYVVNPDDKSCEFGVVIADAWRFGLGARYHATPQWDLRFGTMYDQSPIRSADLRTPRLPDQDRVWATVGTSYHLTKAFDIDLAYAHRFMVGSAKTNMDATGENTDLGGLKGSYDNMGDIVSAQINYAW